MRKLAFFLFFIILLAGSLSASTFKILTKGGTLFTQRDFLLTRDSYLEFSPSMRESSWKIAFRAQQDSYDSILWGDTSRWGFKFTTALNSKSFEFKFGPGISLASSMSLKNQLSLDAYLYLRFAFIFLEAENLFFKDGSLHRNYFGFEFRLQRLGFILAFSGLLNTDYTDILFYPGLSGGVCYEF
jgi:hypothetical protein